MKNLFYRLIIFLDTAQENDTNYNIAWFMANNFYRIANMRISELAAECFVSPATISRFCRALGYENFAHLKQECYTFHSHDKKFNNLINISLETMKDSPLQATQQYIQQVIQYISDLPKLLDWNEVDAILKLIHDSESVAFFGTQFSQSAALHLQTDLLMLEKFTMAYMDSSRQLECAKQLNQSSVAIIMTVNGCQVVLMTCHPQLDLKIPVHHKLVLGQSKNRKTGKHSLLTAVELMSLRYYCLYYPSLQELKGHLL